MNNFYKFYILLEGKVEDFVKENPDLHIAYSQGVRNINYLKWLLINKEQEPLQDIIPLIFAFEKNKNRLTIKDIFQYKNPNLLRQEIEKLGQSKGKLSRLLKDNETTKLGEFGDWLVVMPHTRESSCQWGKGTTWCTAATQSGNLFLNYVARKDENIVLYYLIKKGVDSTQDPNGKISIGLINGKPVYQGSGGLTVNAKNQGVDEGKLRQILDDQYEKIMNSIIDHSKIIEGKHPAKKQMEFITQSKDPKILDNHLSRMKEDEIEDFFIMVYDKQNPNNYKLSDELILHIAEKYPKFLEESFIEEIIYKLPNEKLKYIFKYWKENQDKDFDNTNLTDTQRKSPTFEASKNLHGIIVNTIRNSGIRFARFEKEDFRDAFISSKKKNLLDRLDIIISNVLPNSGFSVTSDFIKNIQNIVNEELGQESYEPFDKNELSFELLKKIIINTDNFNYQNVDQILRSIEKYKNQYEIVKLIKKHTHLYVDMVCAILINMLGERSEQKVNELLKMIDIDRYIAPYPQEPKPFHLSDEMIFKITKSYPEDWYYQWNAKKIKKLRWPLKY